VKSSACFGKILVIFFTFFFYFVFINVKLFNEKFSKINTSNRE